jgi:hypothetical protein
MSDMKSLLEQLATLTTEDVGPFPYDGCREMKNFDATTYAALIPDLDRYLSEIAGYRSWGKRLMTWPDEKIDEVERRIRQSFTDRHPEYARAKFPSDVQNALDVADRTRSVLSEIFRRLRAERVAS